MQSYCDGNEQENQPRISRVNADQNCLLSFDSSVRSAQSAVGCCLTAGRHFDSLRALGVSPSGSRLRSHPQAAQLFRLAQRNAAQPQQASRDDQQQRDALGSS